MKLEVSSARFEAMIAPTARAGLSGDSLVVFLEVVTDSGGTLTLAR